MSDHTPLDKAKAALEAAKEKEALGLERQELLQIAAAQACIDTADTLRRIEVLVAKGQQKSPVGRRQPVNR